MTEFKVVIGDAKSHKSYQKVVSDENANNLVGHKIGFSLITPRQQHIRHDQGKVDKFREEFKKNSNRRIWVVN